MDLTNLIIQLIAGAAGGTAAGTALKDLSLGKPGDAITGAIGGGIIGQLLPMVLGAAAVGDVSSLRAGTLLRDIFGGGIDGAVVLAVVGVIRNAMMKR